MNKPRTTIYAANWKMNMDSKSCEQFLQQLSAFSAPEKSQLMIFPPAVYLQQLATGGSNFSVGAQNIYFEEKGAFTGEVSALMAKDCGAQYVMCGHSERRHIFGESAEVVTKKALAAERNGLVPLLCVGETLAQREQQQTLTCLHDDLWATLPQLAPTAELVIAYEPVWAIGTGLAATAEDAEQACKYIREQVRAIYGSLADDIRILYGGSVSPANIAEIMACPNIDGALIGGASLQAESFMAIVCNGEE